MLNRSSSEEFRTRYDEARQIWKGLRGRNFFESGVVAHMKQGYRLEESAQFYSKDEFTKRFGMSVAEAKVATEHVGGREGIVIQDVGPKRLVLYSDVVVDTRKTVLWKDYRPDQAEEIAKWYHQQHASLQHLHTVDSLVAKIEQMKQDKLVQQEKQKMAAELEQSMKEDTAAVAAKADDASSDVDDARRVQSTPFQTAVGQCSKKKGKKDKDTRKQAKAQAKSYFCSRRSVASTMPIAASTGSPGSSDVGASSVHGGKSVGSVAKGSWHEADANKKMDKYKAELRLEDVLSQATSTAKGNLLWQAATSLSAWSKSKPTAPQTVILRGIYEAAKLANSLTGDAIVKLSKEARNSALAELSAKVPSWPPELQGNILLCHCKELLHDEHYVANMIQLCFPTAFQEEQKFDYKDPRMCCCSHSAEQKASLLQSMMTESFVGLVVKGDAGKAIAVKLAEKLQEAISAEPECASTVLSSAFEDAMMISKALLALLGSRPDAGSSEALSALSSSRSGSKFLVHEALTHPSKRPGKKSEARIVLG